MRFPALEEWKSRRKIKGELNRLREFYLPRLKAARGQEAEELAEQYYQERCIPEAELDHIETRKLLRKARKYLIEVPNDGDWWEDEEDYLLKGNLTEVGQLRLRRLISNEQYAHIKKWVEFDSSLIDVACGTCWRTHGTFFLVEEIGRIGESGPCTGRDGVTAATARAGPCTRRVPQISNSCDSGESGDS